MLKAIIAAWTAKDSAAAAEFVKNLPPGDSRKIAITELCQQWAITNAVADTNTPSILAWAQSLSSENERVAVTNQVVVHWAHHDPQAASQFAEQHPELSGQVFGDIAAALAKTNLTAATNWLAGLGDEEKKRVALSAVAETWGQVDPQGLAVYAASLPAGDSQKFVIKGLLSTWAVANPEAAVNWLVSFPETNAQPEAVSSVIKAWSQREPAAVAKWLATVPLEIASEARVSAFLEGAAAKYPEYAAQWTQSVTNETQRQKYQVQVAQQWLQVNPTAATNWLNSLDLPAALKP
jgi:hypothetical protein